MARIRAKPTMAQARGFQAEAFSGEKPREMYRGWEVLAPSNLADGSWWGRRKSPSATPCGLDGETANAPQTGLGEGWVADGPAAR